MSPKLKQVTKDAIALPLEERGLLASKLIDTLNTEELVSEEEAGEAWDKEIARRVEEIKSGKVEGIPSEQVQAEIRAKRPWLK